MTFIRIVSGFLLVMMLDIASASAEPVKLIFTTLAAPDSRAAAAVFHPFAERINAAGKDVVQLDVRDGFALANFDNAYSRVMDDVIQVSWALQGAIGSYARRLPGCPSSRTIARRPRPRSGAFTSRARSVPNTPTSCHWC
jgi:hypothetical protein